MNNFVPMNMIPFIANMDNAKPVSDDPKPQPFNPHDMLNKVVTFDFGEVEDITWLASDLTAFINLEPAVFESLLNMCEDAPYNGLPAFKFKYEGKDYIIISYEKLGEYSIGNLVDIDMDDASLTEHHTFDYIEMITDSETGDSIVILGLNQ